MDSENFRFSFIVSYFAYYSFEYVVRAWLFGKVTCDKALRPSSWKAGKEFACIISPGYYLARYFKNKIITFNDECASLIRQDYLKAMNSWNLRITLCLTGIYLIGTYANIPYTDLLSGFIVIRFISRVFEITYAFVNDVLSNKNRGFVA